MIRPRLLDLFCGAGGAAMGYHRAMIRRAGLILLWALIVAVLLAATYWAGVIGASPA